jgi:K(+)-stimulated pyrophosphate-energized sodium pump
LTALALFAAFMKTAGVVAIDVSQPQIMAGLLIGGMLPFVFSALSMNAVGRAAMAMIEEVRRQFRDIPALRAALDVMIKYDSDMTKASAADRKIFDEADGVAEYDKCVAISTTASIKEMVLPGVLAIVVPVAIGFIGGAEMLGGLLAGVTTCGVLMAIFQSNAGGAWDNAKKMIEEQGRKGTEAHKAAVVGDTVGDPFKDTSGPSLNILLKLMSVVALVIAPSIAMDSSEMTAYNLRQSAQEQTIEVVVPGEDTDNTVEVTIRTAKDEEEMTVQVTADSKGQPELHRHIDEADDQN